MSTERGWILSRDVERGTPPLIIVLVPVLAVATFASLLTGGWSAPGSGHLRTHLLWFLLLGGGFWFADRAVRFSTVVWWLCVGLISLNLTMAIVSVNGDEIFNVELGIHVLRLDHPMHLVAAFVATIACWEALCSVVPPVWHLRLLTIALAALAALGLGALKELSDAIGSINDDPAGVVWSTRWDLIFNAGGAALAAAFLWTRGRVGRNGKTAK